MAAELTNIGTVALLIDFENLVLGLSSNDKSETLEQFDPVALFSLSEKSGQVVVAQAYADWRSFHVNRHQQALYRAGIDLIHVFGKSSGNGFKNAVDVKMAVDAIEMVWMLPHVQTYVLVSGDRDFIHLLKALRRHGKTIVGVSPKSSISADFAELCDRFVEYESLVEMQVGLRKLPPVSHGESESAVESISLDQVKDALRQILDEHADGLFGSKLKVLLRRRLVTFDELNFGYQRFSDLLRSLPDIARLIPPPTGVGDIRVFSVHVEGRN
ncbi:NYN domain-containing protein [bacterium]|nr:MAG: NYN domain-containing protein [bacterium]